MLGSKGLKSLLLAHPPWGLSLQVPEGIPHGAVPTLCATQMHSAPTLHLLPLALREPETSPVHPPSGRHLQLQPRRLLHQVRRGHRPLPGGRRVSTPPPLPAACPQRSLMSPESDALRIGQAESEKPTRGCFWEYCCSLACLPVAWTWAQTPPSFGGGPFFFTHFWETLHRLFSAK